MAGKNTYLYLSPLKITAIYLVIAGLWIVFSDTFLESLITDQPTLSTFQTYKGLFYVIITSIGLFYLIRELNAQIHQRKRKLEDISDELDSEQELIAKLFERIPVMISTYDPKMNEFYANREFEKVTGYTNDEISGINLLESLYPDLDTREEAVEFMDSPGMGWKEFPLVTKEGTEIPTSWTNLKLTDDTSVGIGIDMSEIKASQAEVRKSQALLRKTFEHVPIGIAVNKIDEGTTTIINKKFSEIYGWPKEELKDIASFFKKVYPDKEYREKIQKQILEDIESGDPERMQWNEVSITTQEGEQRFVNAKNILISSQNLMISTVLDVTAQKKAEEERVQTLERIDDAFFAVNKDWVVTYWNKKAEELLETPHHKIINKNLWDIFSDATELESYEQYHKALDEQITVHFEDFYPPLQKWYEISVYPSDSGLSVFFKDITQLKEMQEELLQSEEKYRHLFENNPEPMWIYNPDTLGFVEVNRAAINHYGYTEEEFLAMTLADIRPPEDVEALKKDVDRDFGINSYSEEWQHLKKDGTLIDVAVSAADVHYKDKVYRLILINDITERKRVQEKIIQSVIEGEDRERKRISYELHDGLGQYLVAANMNFESIKNDIEVLGNKRQEQFATGLSLLKNALFETRSIAYNLMPKAIADYGMYVALENLIEDYRKSTIINFEFYCNHEDLQLTEKAEINIYRILQETISNAVRHADCDNLSITLKKENDTLRIVIKDDGVGTQLNGQHEEQGLGLRSIKTRVTNLNGKLNIYSEPGNGMETTIKIPVTENLLKNGEL